MKIVASILLLINSVFVFAQQKVDDVDYQYDKSFLEMLVQDEIEIFRKENGLPVLKKDSILSISADDHTAFLLKTGRITHNQPSAKKKTPYDRVMFYDGMHGKVQENCYKLAIGSLVKLPGGTKKVKLKSYQNVAKAIALYWISTKDGAKVLSNPKYVTYGISAQINYSDNSIIITHLVGSAPFNLPEGVKPMTNDFGILPYDKNKCSLLTKTYSYLPQLMSDNIFFKNGEIFFYFHDLALLQAVLNESGDAITLDIISREQYSCDSGNKFYPSKIHKGVMLPPVGKSQLFKSNQLKGSNELEVSFGPIPSYLDTNNVEFNLLMIKGNCLCQTIIYNSLGGENLKSLDLNFLIDTLSVSSKSDSILNKITFTVPFKINKSAYSAKDLKPFLDSLSLNRFDLKQIEILAYSSLDGSKIGNEILQQKRAKSILVAIKKYKLQEVKTKVLTQENWDGFYSSIKGSPYEKYFEGLSKEETRKKINTDSLKIKLEPFLAQQRKAIISLTVGQILVDDELLTILPELFEKAINDKDYVKAKIYQSVLLKNINNGTISIPQILAIKIPHLKETIPFVLNQIALTWYSSKEENIDRLNLELYTKIDSLLIIDPTNSFLKYNQSVLRLLLWSSDYSRETNPRLLLREIRLLASTNVETWMVNRLILNYNIIAADYFYDNKLFTDREKALSNVKKALFSSNLDRDQSYRIANYFMFQLRIDWAIDIMKPFAMKATIDEDFLFTFLTVAIYNKEKVPQKEYEEFMLRAKNMNKERFCELFGFPNLSFQLLKDISVKKLFCATCN